MGTRGDLTGNGAERTGNGGKPGGTSVGPAGSGASGTGIPTIRPETPTNRPGSRGVRPGRCAKRTGTGPDNAGKGENRRERGQMTGNAVRRLGNPSNWAGTVSRRQKTRWPFVVRSFSHRFARMKHGKFLSRIRWGGGVAGRGDTNFTNCRKYKYAEGVTEISRVLGDAIGLRRENVPQNNSLSPRVLRSRGREKVVADRMRGVRGGNKSKTRRAPG